MAFWLPVVSLWRRELVRFARDRNRLFGAIGQPLVFWLLLGAGFEKSFAPQGISSGYLEYIYPGILLLIVLFTAIFSTISVIEDRREGFMQSVLVAPVSRIGLVLGKVLGGGTLAFLESLIFLVFLAFLDIPISIASLGMTLIFLAVLGIALTALGFAIAWQASSTAGFHAVMNLFLLPMWALSGAFFPRRRRVALAGVPDGNKSIDLWYGRIAPISLPHNIRRRYPFVDLRYNKRGICSPDPQRSRLAGVSN